MSTFADTEGLAASLFGKTRRAVLALLYSHPDEAFYLRQLARVTGSGLGAIQREVRNLSDAGIIRRTVRGHQVYYQANDQCPIFSELKSLVVKTAGTGDVLRVALAPLADRVTVAFICGSVAGGKQRRTSDIDVVVIGDVSFAEIVSELARAQERLAREINPVVYPPPEFREKLAKGHHFLKTVTKGPKIFLIGDDRELKRLAKKQLAG